MSDEQTPWLGLAVPVRRGDILSDYPDLEAADLKAVQAYAARLVRINLKSAVQTKIFTAKAPIHTAGGF